MIALSPGIAQGCMELLRLVTPGSLTVIDIRAAFPYLSGLPVGRLLEVAQVLQWIRSREDGAVTVVPNGSRLLSQPTYESSLRQALLDYVDALSPAWLQSAVSGRARVIAFAGAQIGQMFVEAGLAHGNDDAVVTFWDALAARARGLVGKHLTAVGRKGERLTIDYEKRRTGFTPKWIAIESNEDGYDVLSIVSKLDRRSLSVEVKTSSQGQQGVLHLSRNEWERALETQHHTFHLWAIEQSDSARLAVVSPEEMKLHISEDHGDGKWENLEIPFAAFSDFFTVAVALQDDVRPEQSVAVI